MEYLLHILIMIGIYIILSVSLNLIAGYTGLISLAHAAFYGIGAYVAALLALNVNTPFLVNLIIAVLISGLAGMFVGVPSLRIRDEYFLIATFAFQLITFSIFNNWIALTGGPMGLPGIPQPAIFSFNISSSAGFFIIVCFFCSFSLWVSHLVVESPFGRVLKSIREDEIFTQAAGKNVTKFKIFIFVIGSGMSAIAGVVYAYYISFVDPTKFTVMESIFILSIVIIGGAGSLLGPVAGALVLVSIPEILRFIGLPGVVSANIRQILYGGLLVTFIIWKPRGLLGEFAFKSGKAQE